jgi:hypothetical protein
MNQDLDNMFALLDQLVRLHEQMIATLDRQLAAARAADGDSMRQCQEQTEELVRQVARVEAQRRTLSRNLAIQVGIDAGPVGRGVTASVLANALPEPHRSRLIHQAGLLRQRIQEVDRLNKLLADVSRRILLHIRSAYEMVARAAGTTGVYAANGRLRREARSTVFEVVG